VDALKAQWFYVSERVTLIKVMVSALRRGTRRRSISSIIGSLWIRFQGGIRSILCLACFEFSFLVSIAVFLSFHCFFVLF